MATAGRHIRHDWKTFVDWEQNSVRAVCGVTTKRHLAGIPGITEQPEIVRTPSKNLWGWCAKCVLVATREASEAREIVTPVMTEPYVKFLRTVGTQYNWMLEKQLAYRPRLAQNAPE